MKKLMLSIFIILICKIAFTQEIIWGPTYESFEKNSKEVNYTNSYEVLYNPDADFEYLEYNKKEEYFTILYKEKQRFKKKFYIHKYSLKDYSLINSIELNLSSMNEESALLHQVILHNNLIYAICSSYNLKNQERTFYYQSVSSELILSKPVILFIESNVETEYNLSNIDIHQSKNKKYLMFSYNVKPKGEKKYIELFKFYNSDMKLYDEKKYSSEKIKDSFVNIKIKSTSIRSEFLDNLGNFHRIVTYEHKISGGFDKESCYVKITTTGIEVKSLNDKGKRLENISLRESSNGTIFISGTYSYSNTSEEFSKKKVKVNVNYGVFISKIPIDDKNINLKIIPITDFTNKDYSIDYMYILLTFANGLHYDFFNFDNNQNIYLSYEQNNINNGKTYVQNQFIIKLNNNLDLEWSKVIMKKQGSNYYWQPYSSFSFIYDNKFIVYQNEPLKKNTKTNKIVELKEYGNYPILSTIFNHDGTIKTNLDETLLPKGLTLVPLRCKKFDDGVIFYAEDIGNRFCFGGYSY